MASLDGKRILLTGAAGGIGSATTRLLSRMNARMLLADLGSPALEQLARESGQTAVACDVGKREDRAQLVASVEREFGALDGLVHCAGINSFGLHDCQSDELVERIMQINLVAPIQLTRGLIPRLEAGRAPVIVNLGSVFGHIGFPGFSLYSASKFGLHGYTETLRRELADGPVRVAWVSPRATSTGMNTGLVDALNAELKVNYDKPERVARAVAHALAHPPRDVVLGFPEKFFARLNQVFPGMVDGSMVRQLPLIRKYNSLQKESRK